MSVEQMRFSGTSRYTLPWLHADLDEVDELFGGDPWRYGLRPTAPPSRPCSASSSSKDSCVQHPQSKTYPLLS